MLFHEQAKEHGRWAGLTGEVLPLRHTLAVSAGATRTTYVPDDDPVRGRIDPIGTGDDPALANESPTEASTHVVSVDAGADLDVRDRVAIYGIEWRINSETTRTDPLIARYQVQRVDE